MNLNMKTEQNEIRIIANKRTIERIVDILLDLEVDYNKGVYTTGEEDYLTFNAEIFFNNLALFFKYVR